jgi:sulfopropanediol 3-dehydrogenase
MISYLKHATREPVASDPEISRVVSEILSDVEQNGASAVRKYSERFDNWSPERFTLGPDAIAQAADRVPETLRRHIDLAAEQIRQFAAAQRAT